MRPRNDDHCYDGRQRQNWKTTTTFLETATPHPALSRKGRGKVENSNRIIRNGNDKALSVSGLPREDNAPLAMTTTATTNDKGKKVNDKRHY
jgi:hypothetical protein